jgi:phage-related baseplate assembly protein
MPDSFFDIKGNEVSKEGIVADFINNYTGNLTDFNEGSEIRNLLEAFAVYAMGNEERINDILYVMDILNADGEYLDLMASQPGINMERHTGTEAQGSVMFILSEASNEDILVPAGTIVTSRSGIDFETVTDNIMLPGQTVMSCAVRAIDVGKDGNIPAHSLLNKVEDDYELIYGMDVDNPSAFIGGTDFEEDDAFRDRIVARMSLQKFGSKPYYVATLRQEFSDAHDIFFDPTATGYTASIMPNTYKGAAAQAKLEADIADYLGNDNNILLGHTFDVVSPSAQNVNVYFQDGVGPNNGIYVKLKNYDTSTVTMAKEVVEKYFYGGGLSFAPLDLRGLDLYEEFMIPDLRIALKSLGDLFIGAWEYGDVATFGTGKQKYTVSYP